MKYSVIPPNSSSNRAKTPEKRASNPLENEVLRDDTKFRAVPPDSEQNGRKRPKPGFHDPVNT